MEELRDSKEQKTEVQACALRGSIAVSPLFCHSKANEVWAWSSCGRALVGHLDCRRLLRNVKKPSLIQSEKSMNQMFITSNSNKQNLKDIFFSLQPINFLISLAGSARIQRAGWHNIYVQWSRITLYRRHKISRSVMTSPEWNLEFCFPRFSMFPQTNSREHWDSRETKFTDFQGTSHEVIC